MFFFIFRDECQQCLFSSGVQTVRHCGVPTIAGCKCAEKVSDFRQGGNIELGLYPAAARFCYFHKQRHEDGCETARAHSILQQTACKFRDVFGKYQAALEANSDKERDADDHAVAIVDAILNDDLQADYEER